MKYKKIISAVVIASALFAIWLIAVVGQVRSRDNWMCPVCASQKHKNTWLFGFTSEPVIQESALARWISDHDEACEHKWQFLNNNGYNVFGSFLSCGIGSTPLIYPFHGEFLADYLDTVPESEIKEFVWLMSTGSEAEQEKAVERFYDPFKKRT